MENTWQYQGAQPIKIKSFFNHWEWDTAFSMI